MSALHVDHVEDAEGDGHCGACDRDGLRWVVVLSDGSRIGSECAKRVLGISVQPKNHQWQKAFTLIATYTEYGQTWGLWQHRTGNHTNLTCNGALHVVGGARHEWVRRGYPPLPGDDEAS